MNWAPRSYVITAGMPNLVIKSRNSTHAQAAAGVDSPPGGFVNYREQVGESFRGRQGSNQNQVHVHVAETSGKHRDVLGLHVDMPEDLTLLTGQAHSGHGSHV